MAFTQNEDYIQSDCARRSRHNIAVFKYCRFNSCVTYPSVFMSASLFLCTQGRI